LLEYILFKKDIPLNKMSKCISFVVGIVVGAYVAQTYKVPKVTTIIQTVVTKISEYENK
jgi:DMSO reductase anchor subunit